MAFETAVRNPERYKSILTAIEPFKGKKLDDETLLEVVTTLYLEAIVSSPEIIITEESNIENLKDQVATVNSTRKADGGYPEGYQSRFWTYVRTLSELGFVYAQYNELLLFSEITNSLISGKIDEQEAFSIQAIKYNRRSPYRNVSNDFNYFRFILEVLKEKERISYEQFIVSTFSYNGDVQEFLDILKAETFGTPDEVEDFIRNTYNSTLARGTILKDYPDVVLRLLLITGFVSIQYKGKVFINRNLSNDDYINDLLKVKIELTDQEKEDSLLFFKKLESYNGQLLDIVQKYQKPAKEKDGYDYVQKVKEIIRSYELTEDLIIESIQYIGTPKNVVPSFKYIAEPLKLEFFLSLLLALKYGDEFAIQPNYKADYVGLPISHAPGNKGDIELYTDSIYWLIEVTLIRNKTQQLNSETTSVFRHFKEDNAIQEYSKKYLSFIAPYIHPDTKEFFDFSLIKHKSKDTHLCLNSYSIEDFIAITRISNNINDMEEYSLNVIEEFRKNLE